MLPPVLHNSGKKKVLGRHAPNRTPAEKDRWGTLVYRNEKGESVTERIPVGFARYERIYDNLVGAVENGDPKIIRDEEVIKVLEILEEATKVAQGYVLQG